MNTGVEKFHKGVAWYVVLVSVSRIGKDWTSDKQAQVFFYQERRSAI